MFTKLGLERTINKYCMTQPRDRYRHASSTACEINLHQDLSQSQSDKKLLIPLKEVEQGIVLRILQADGFILQIQMVLKITLGTRHTMDERILSMA